MLSHNLQFDPPIGVAEDLGAGVRRVVAPNPSAMTFRGTNTYLIGTSNVAVIDPGPANPLHLDALLYALAPKQRVSHILVTHTHSDHAPLAPILSRETNAPVYGFGNASAGRSAIMQTLSEAGLAGGGEGIDDSFAPDVVLFDGAEIIGEEWRLTALHTPGHIGNHLCFRFGDILFSGDLVMGWASSLVSPPDGDLADFMRSCRRLQATVWNRFYPGHGAPVTAPNRRLECLIAHRRRREASILEVLKAGPAGACELARQIYTTTPVVLHSAATRNVLAHLIYLTQQQRIRPLGELSQYAAFALITD